MTVSLFCFIQVDSYQSRICTVLSFKFKSIQGMPYFAITIFLALLLMPDLQAQDLKSDDRLNELSGTWQIDLRPSPDSDPYFQEFKVEKVRGQSFTGSFYGSKIRDVLVNTNWDKLHFAFTTSDNTHDYFHSGYLLKGKLIGTSYCPGRDLIQPWIGVKE